MALTLERLLAGLRPEYAGCDARTEVRGLVADSRRVRAGFAFLALPGERVDGHRFVPKAIEAGAALVIVQRGAMEAPSHPHVWLEDTFAAMPTLAANAHDWPGQSMRCFGITGTNGKTTVTHLLSDIFDAAERPHARLGTTGNWIVDREVDAGFTTPFPIELQGLLARAREAGARDAIMEVSSHALDQDRVAPLRFNAIAMTSFSQDHLDYHEDMESYLAAKLRLATEYLAEAALAVAAVDDNPAGRDFLAASVRARGRWAVSRGADPRAEVRAEEVRMHARGIRARVHTPEGEVELRSPMVGSFNLDNLMVTIALAHAAGIESAVIEDALRRNGGAPGRLESVDLEGRDALPSVYVDYAHTPDAVERALEVLRPHVEGRLIVVLGCGGDRDPDKRPMMGAAASRGADLFYATSDNPRSEDPEAILAAMVAGASGPATLTQRVDRAAAIAEAIAEARPEDTVLIAGKGHEDYQILGETKIHFDDREHAREALARRAGAAG